MDLDFKLFQLRELQRSLQVLHLGVFQGNVTPEVFDAFAEVSVLFDELLVLELRLDLS